MFVSMKRHCRVVEELNERAATAASSAREGDERLRKRAREDGKLAADVVQELASLGGVNISNYYSSYSRFGIIDLEELLSDLKIVNEKAERKARRRGARYRLFSEGEGA